MAVVRWMIALSLLPLVACAQTTTPPPSGALANAAAGPDVVEAARLIDEVKCTDLETLGRIDGLLKKAIADARPKMNSAALVERARYQLIAGSGCTTKASDPALAGAQMSLTMALLAAPDSAAAMIQMARVKTQMDRNDEALAHLKKAESLGSRDAQLYVHRALAYTAMKNWSAADEALRKVPACRLGHTVPAQCGGRLGAQAKIDLYTAMNDRDAALRAYREAVAAFPTSAFMHGNLAAYLMNTIGDVDGAIAEVDQAMAIRPYGKLMATQAIAHYAKWAQLRNTDPAAAAQFRGQAESTLPLDAVLSQVACGIGGNPATQALAAALVQEGMSIDAGDASGNTALMTAAGCGLPADLTWLLSQKASSRKTNDDGFTALAQAAYAGRLDNLEVLLPTADLSATDREGDTALLLAAYGNHTDVALRLIKAKAGLDHVNAQGETALIRAARRGNDTLVRALLDAGADTKPRSQGDSKDAAESAEAAGRKDLAGMIRAR
ncbi:ankyrin repeat domain-containing protein [Lysobacter sp. Hz 25]|uniref:ankyrin repeat domain-containing protein n=1 Tax=Lysobacter sp. Hz 25 TaxID=3383698 RepID=UPI0038D3A4B0